MIARALAVALIAVLSACGEGTSPNQVDAALLTPALLREDAQQVQAYMAKLPAGYTEYRVDTIGRFYVDDDKDVIKRYIKENYVWERHLVELFARYAKPASTVIDAGAHIGMHTVSLARLVGPEGRVYAFEPQRKIFRELVFNVRLNDLDKVAVPLRFALGHTAAVAAMDRATPGNEGSTQLGSGGDPVELRTLDSFAFRNVSLIKIDVEHFEDFLLEGAQLTIARYKPVLIVEIMGGYVYEDAPAKVKAQVDATSKRIRAMGYKVTRVGPYDYLAVPE